jgi:hypothetical protein
MHHIAWMNIGTIFVNVYVPNRIRCESLLIDGYSLLIDGYSLGINGKEEYK